MSDIQRASMTEQEAHRLTERIRIAAVNYTEAKEKLLKLVSEAKDGAAHEALGYKSWTAYLADVMSEEPLRLARDERREVVQLLTEEGMSTRAIAPIVGASPSTVKTDVQQVANSGHVTGADGKTYTRTAPSAPPAESALSPDEIYDEETGEIISTTPEPERTPEQEKSDKDLALINDIRLYLGHMGRSRQIKNMSPTARQHIIDALEDTISAIKGETS